MAAPTFYYLNHKLVEARLSVATVRRIFDDLNIGIVSFDDDENPVVQCMLDAESKFEGFCKGIYDLSALRDSANREARRLALDVFEAMAAKRFPRAMGRNWVELEQSVNAELREFKKGGTRLPTDGPPEPGANVGGYVSNGDALNPGEPNPMTFNGNWGSY